MLEMVAGTFIEKVRIVSQSVCLPGSYNNLQGVKNGGTILCMADLYHSLSNENP